MKKYLTITGSLFTLCLICSVANLKASDQYSIVGFEIKAYGATTSLGTELTRSANLTPTHKYTNTQTYKLYGNSEDTNIKVRIHKNSGDKNSRWLEYSKGQTQKYDDSKNEADINIPGKYTVYYKNPSFTAYKLSHTGVWYHY